MSVNLNRPLIAELRHEVSALRGNWLWFVVLGVSLVVLGMITLSWPLLSSVAVVLTLGILMILGGVSETVGSFWCRGWSGFFLHLLSGILSVVVGVLIFRAPGAAMATLTLLIAGFLMVGGIFKIAAVASFRFASWGLALLSGIIDLVLGVMIWQEWWTVSHVLIGIFLGINLIFRGFHWIGLGLAVRSLPKAEV